MSIATAPAVAPPAQEPVTAAIPAIATTMPMTIHPIRSISPTLFSLSDKQ
ncbi:MAG: hypothetical protein V5A27_10205 [Halapricum sp.]